MIPRRDSDIGTHHSASVVLGADSPFGLPLILDLEKKGYIVIASVAIPEDVEPLEQQTQGYVKALVLDPYEVRLCNSFADCPPSCV